MWSAIERFSAQGIQFLLTLVIARLLLPSDYGLIAMIGIFIAIAQTFIDSGFSNALIQKQNRTEADYSTVFYFNLIVGVFFYLILFFVSPLIAQFYSEPDLVLIIKVVGLNLIINSLAIVQRTKLIIALNFKIQTYISIISVILSGVIGVWMAYNSFGVWALICQTLLQSLLNMLGLWFYAKWHPAFVFSYHSFKSLFGFGSKILLSGLLHTIYMNLYSLVIGKKFASAELGYYNRAYTFTFVIYGNLTEVFARAIYPIQCNLQNDNEMLRASFIRYIKIACYVIFPLMIGLGALAKPLVIVLLTEKWLPSVELIQIMCLGYMWDVVMRLNYTILNVKGRSDYILKSEILKKALAVAILFFTMQYGLKTMCWGIVFYAFCDIFIVTQFMKKIIHIGFFRELKIILPTFLLAFSMGIVVYCITMVVKNGIAQILVGTLVGILYYLVMSWMFKFKEFDVIKRLIYKRI